jgi:hypothetical protein
MRCAGLVQPRFLLRGARQRDRRGAGVISDLDGRQANAARSRGNDDEVARFHLSVEDERAIGRQEHHPDRRRFDERKRVRVLHDGMVGRENDLAISRVFIQGECGNRTYNVAHGKTDNLFAHGIDNAGAIISETRREDRGFDIFVIAPHRVGTVDADCFHLDSYLVRTRKGNFRFDEFEDFRSSGLCEFDRAGHDASIA